MDRGQGTGLSVSSSPCRKPQALSRGAETGPCGGSNEGFHLFLKVYIEVFDLEPGQVAASGERVISGAR